MKRKILKLDRIKEMRLQKKMTQEDVARAIGVSSSTYFAWENGVTNCPIYALIKLTEIYDTSMDYLLEITDNPTPLTKNRTQL